MSLSVSSQVSPVGSKLAVQTDVSVVPDNDVFGGSATVWMIDVDNSANAAQDNYVKIVDGASSTPGTTVPDYVIKILQGARRQLVIPEGLAFSTGVSMWCVTTGGTGGTTSPTSDVIVRIVAS